MTRLLLVCAGGAAGSGLRYLVILLSARLFGTAAPWSTFLVNVTGSLAMGFVMEIATRTDSMSPELRLLLTTGVLGGFTTYSAFNYETTALLRSAAWMAAATNVVGTLAGCLLAGAAGFRLAEWLYAR